MQNPSFAARMPLLTATSTFGLGRRHWLLTVVDAVNMMNRFLSNCAVLRYDARCYFNVRSKADMSQLNLPHGKFTVVRINITAGLNCS